MSVLDKDNYGWLTSLCALIWYCPQVAFKFGECKEQPKAPSYQEIKATTVKQLKGEVRAQTIKTAVSFFVPFIKF